MHRFGGAWTELKLDIIEGYLGFYTAVLEKQPRADDPFKLWYVDAFAGSGTRTVDISGGSIFGEPDRQVCLEGSARRALRIQRPFSRYIFIEGDGGRFAELDQLRAEFPDRAIACLPGDANDELRKVFTNRPWDTQRGGRGSHRAVVFLDPYGMAVRWKTLELLAATRAVDVWYLFPLEAVNRQLASDASRIDRHKRVKLEEIFGTQKWEQDLYEPIPIGGLFGDQAPPLQKVGSKRAIEAYAVRRFGTLFRYVSPPIALTGPGRGQIFSLICLSNSESEAAIALIKKGVTWLREQYAYAASRRTFSP